MVTYLMHDMKDGVGYDKYRLSDNLTPDEIERLKMERRVYAKFFYEIISVYDKDSVHHQDYNIINHANNILNAVKERGFETEHELLRIKSRCAYLKNNS
jgi:hypothetical protein